MNFLDSSSYLLKTQMNLSGFGKRHPFLMFSSRQSHSTCSVLRLSVHIFRFFHRKAKLKIDANEIYKTKVSPYVEIKHEN